MKTILLFIFCVTGEKVFSQQNWSAFQISVARSWHGSGDLPGYSFDVGYDHSFSRRVDLYTGLTSTIHYGESFILSIPENNQLHFTTAGVQLTSLLHYALIASRDHRFKFGAGPIVRFQSTSDPNSYSIGNDPLVAPYPYYVIYDHGPQNIITVGYTFGFTYLPRISNKFHLGIKAIFQNDTNGDAITQLGIVFGRFTGK